MTPDPDRETPMPGVPQPALLEARDGLAMEVLDGLRLLNLTPLGMAPRPLVLDAQRLLEQAGALSDALMRGQLEADPWAVCYRAALCRCRQRLHDAMIAFAAAEEREAGRRA